MKPLLLLSLLIAPALYGNQKDPRQAPDKKPRQTSQQESREEAPTFVIGSVEQWQARAEDRFPELRTPGSAFQIAFQAAYRAMQANNPGFLAANDWPDRLAESVAQSLKEGKTTPSAVVRR